MVSLFNRLTKLSESMSGWLLGVITIVVTLQVLFRYVLGIIAPWTEELARYVAIWMVYAGALAATFRSDHIRVTVLFSHLSAVSRTVVEVFASIVAISVCIIVFFGSIGLICGNWQQSAVTIPVSVVVLYIPLTIFSLLSVFSLITEIVTHAKERKGWK